MAHCHSDNEPLTLIMDLCHHYNTPLSIIMHHYHTNARLIIITFRLHYDDVDLYIAPTWPIVRIVVVHVAHMSCSLIITRGLILDRSRSIRWGGVVDDGDDDDDVDDDYGGDVMMMMVMMMIVMVMTMKMTMMVVMVVMTVMVMSGMR